MRTSKNPLALQSQNWIYSSLIKLLCSISYDDITVSMICKNAGIDRCTFYRYFDNKQDVLHSYINKIFNEYLERLVHVQSINKVEYIQLFFDFWSNEYREFLCALQRNKLLHMAFIENERYLTEINSLLDAILERNSNSYEISYRAGGLINVLSLWIANGFIESPDDMAAIISRILK